MLDFEVEMDHDLHIQSEILAYNEDQVLLKILEFTLATILGYVAKLSDYKIVSLPLCIQLSPFGLLFLSKSILECLHILKYKTD